MYRYRRVKGLPVFTAAEGKQVGKIDEVVVDPDRKAVAWLRLHVGGLFGERVWIPVDAVRGIGDDAVTIHSEADIRTAADAPEADAVVKSDRPVIGNVVVSENGQRLGKVRDFEFSPEGYALANLHIPPELNFLGQFLVVPGDKILTIGSDAIIVTQEAVIGRESTNTAENETLAVKQQMDDTSAIPPSTHSP